MKSAQMLLCVSTMVLFYYKSTTAFVVAPTIRTYYNKSNILSTLFAKKKKKGGKKNKSQKNQSGFAWASSFTLKPNESASLRELAEIACRSYLARTGKPLTEDLRTCTDIPKALWNSPSIACVVVGESNDGKTTAIQYANMAALETVGLQPDEFEQLLAIKDQKSGEWKMSENIKRSMDLPGSMKGGKAYESGYKKKIVRSEDVDISIENAQRWVLEKSALIEGKFVTESLGVAYAWSSWLEGGDTLCKPGGVREVNINVGDLREQIKVQGGIIRELKEVQGFGNKDPQVVDAVEELLRMKALLEDVSK